MDEGGIRLHCACPEPCCSGGTRVAAHAAAAAEPLLQQPAHNIRGVSAHEHCLLGRMGLWDQSRVYGILQCCVNSPAWKPYTL